MANDGKALINNLRSFSRGLNKEIPTVVSAIMLRQTELSFKNERFEGDYSNRWEKRKAFGGEGNILYPLLNFKGRLSKSFKNSIKRTKNLSIVSIGTNVQYAKTHNEGGKFPIYHIGRRYVSKGHIIKKAPAYGGGVPKRQFLGIGSKTRYHFRRQISKQINSIFKMYL